MNSDEEIDPLGWRIGKSIVHGEIDGRGRDRVTGRLWLIDRQFPIEITLKGNLLRDLAGCLVTFENPDPAPEENDGLSPVQMGRTGDITASRKVQVFDLPLENVMELKKRDEPIVSHIANALYMEWYSNANGRVVVESTTFHIKISDYAWRMTQEEEKQQRLHNKEAFQRWAEIVELEDEEGDMDDDDSLDWYMDEFEWEKQLRESDAITERYMQLIETYIDHPDRERIIAHEMGWNWLEDALDDDDSDFDDMEFGWATPNDEDENLSPLEPNPLTEGRDWIRTRDGKVRHPLSNRASNAAISVWRYCKEHDLVGKGNDPDLHNMLFHAQTLSAKLSGALDSLAYDEDPDGGFVVACLKRSLKVFGQTIKSASLVSQKSLIPAPELQSFRDEFFAVRQEILALMQYYRQIN